MNPTIDQPLKNLLGVLEKQLGTVESPPTDVFNSLFRSKWSGETGKMRNVAYNHWIDICPADSVPVQRPMIKNVN